jgi:glutamine synthetase
MQPEEMRTKAQARAIVEERALQHVKVGIIDNDAVLRGKYIDREKFSAALDKGMGFCDVVLGWDSNDQWEEREFRRAVSDWELARYFEII